MKIEGAGRASGGAFEQLFHKVIPNRNSGGEGAKPLGVVCATSEAEEIVAEKTVFHGFCDFLHRIRGLTCG